MAAPAVKKTMAYFRLEKVDGTSIGLIKIAKRGEKHHLDF
jgi:hypothetical protein